MKFEYDESKFDPMVIDLINDAIKLDSSGELFKILTRTRSDGFQLYSYMAAASLVNVYRYTDSIKEVEKVSLLNSDNKPLYEPLQMHEIAEGYIAGLPIEQIDFCLRLGKDGNPIFNSCKIEAFCLSFKGGLKLEDAEMCVKFDKDGVFAYSAEQIKAIAGGFIHNIPRDCIEIYAQLNENGYPVYEAYEMEVMQIYLRNANPEQIRQFKDSFADGLTLEQAGVFLDFYVPAEKMRIYRSLYKLGCNVKDVNYIVQYRDLAYEDLKKVKYILTCAKIFRDQFPEPKHMPDSFLPFNIVYTKLNNLDELYENFAFNVCDIYSKSMSPSTDVVDAIKKCLDNHIEPEQVHFLVTSGYSADEIKNISDALIEGADFNKIKEARKISKAVLSEKKEIYITSSRPFGKAYGKPSIDLEDLFK